MKDQLTKLKKSELIELIMMTLEKNSSEQTNTTNITDVVFVKSNLYGTIGLMIDKDNAVTIDGKEDSLSLTLTQANQIISKKRYKTLFAAGLLYFSEDRWYKYFGLHKPEIMTDENVSKILSESRNLEESLDQLTNRKTFAPMMNFLAYKIAELGTKGMLQMNYDKQNVIENYFSTQRVPVRLTSLNALLPDRISS